MPAIYEAFPNKLNALANIDEFSGQLPFHPTPSRLGLLWLMWIALSISMR